MLRLAWRNLWRNRTRTAIVLVAISFTYAMMLVSMGINDASHRRMEEAAIRTAGGNLLIHGEGYWLNQSSDQLIEEPEAVLEALSEVRAVRGVVPRVLVTGLLSSPRGSAGVRLTGIDPEAEAQVNDLSRYLVEGRFLDGDTAHPLVLGSGLVEDLAIELGDRVVLTATDPEGEVVRALFRLSGVLRTGTELVDNAMAFTTLGAAREAVAMGERLTQIGVLIDDDSARRDARDALAARLTGTEGLELLTWDEAIPEMVALIEIDDAFGYIYMIVIFVVVGFGIANTFLMSVLERVRELGLLSAIGLTPQRTMGMVLSEALLLAVVSLALGFTLGFGGHLYLYDVGIDIREVYGMDIELAGVTLDDTIIRSELRPVKWLVGSVSVLLLVVLTSVYPAFRAVRLDPAQAMRTYE
jgi:ABC-type lipoprotein release transport system permease subunit